MSLTLRLRAVSVSLLHVPLLFLLAACGDGGEEETKLLFDPAKADQIAHSALIQASDLPGFGWRVESNDDFSEQADPAVLTTACKELDEFRDRIEVIDRTDRAGRAKREFERAVAGQIPVSVEVEIEVYSNPASLEGRLKQTRDLIARRVFQECYGDLLKQDLGRSSPSLSADAVPPTGGVPRDGFGMAVEAINITGLQGALRTEFYGWLRGNVAISLTAIGTNATLTAELINAAVQKTNAALDAHLTK